MSPLLRSVIDIAEVFDHYATHSCEGASLSKKDLKNLLERELGDVLQVRPDQKKKSMYEGLSLFFLRKTRAKNID